MTNNWSFVKLSDICDLVIGRTPPRSEAKYWEGDYPWVTIRDIKDKYINETKEKITELAKIETNSKLISKGTLLLSFKLSIGKVAFAGRDLFTNEAIVALPIKDCSKVYPEYLYYALKFIPLIGVNHSAKGMTLNLKSLKKLEIPIPNNFENQIYISEILSKVDELIKKRTLSISLVNDLKNSIFLEMFGPAAPYFKEWPLKKVFELVSNSPRSIRTGPFGSDLLRNEISEQGDVAVLGIDNVVNNKFEWKKRRYITKEKFENLKKYVVYPRDVLISIMGTTGRSAVIPEKIPLSINTKHLVALTLNENIVNPYFISYALHSSPFQVRQIEKQNRGAIMNGLNLSIIKNIEFKLPPIESQNRFEEILNRLTLLENTLTKNLEELQNLFDSLMQKAYRGKFDLNNISKKNLLESNLNFNELSNEIDTSTELTLTLEDIKKIINDYNRNSFSYTDLWTYIDNNTSYEKVDYDSFKSIVFRLLNDKPPYLLQFFNEKEKKIMLEVNS